MTKRCAIYLRVSDEKQEKDGYGLASQEDGCRKYAAEQGWQIIGVWSDVRSGAYLFERPGLTAVRDLVKQRGVDVVLCHAFDRLSRDQNHRGLIFTEANQAGVEIAAVTERLDDTPEGRLLTAVGGFVAEVERLKIIERTQRGLVARAKSGKPLGTAVAPYGLRWRDEGKTGYDIDPDTVGIVRRIFDECDRGVSLRQIGLRLEADGILPRRHDRSGTTTWGASTVRLILTSGFYTGHGTAFRWETTRRRGQSTLQRFRDPEDQIPLPEGVYPQVINRALCDRVQRRLQTNKRESIRADRNPEVGILRRGIGVCGYCGNTLSVMYSRGVPVYRCGTNVRQRHGCPFHSILVDTLDDAVWRWAWGIALDPKKAAEAIAAMNRRINEGRPDGVTEAEIAAMDQRIAEVERKRRNLVTRLALVDDDEAARLVADQINALSETARSLGEERRRLEAQRDAMTTGLIRLTGIERFCEDVRREVHVCYRVKDLPLVWRPGFREKRQVLHRLGAEVKLWRADHEPRWAASLRLGDGTENLCSIGPAPAGAPVAGHRRSPGPRSARSSPRPFRPASAGTFPTPPCTPPRRS
ncbi:MAG: recombinase family protein [Chloroflexota bacterium]|nr:recombinase family protein [Chloroflexota bacterium]